MKKTKMQNKSSRTDRKFENEKLLLHGLELFLPVLGVPGVDGSVSVQLHNVGVAKRS